MEALINDTETLQRQTQSQFKNHPQTGKNPLQVEFMVDGINNTSEPVFKIVLETDNGAGHKEQNQSCVDGEDGAGEDVLMLVGVGGVPLGILRLACTHLYAGSLRVVIAFSFHIARESFLLVVGSFIPLI